MRLFSPKTLLLSAAATFLLAYGIYEVFFKEKSIVKPVPEKEQHIEIAPQMNALQIYASKLYFAGEAENKALTFFYLHEIEETMEEIACCEVVEDGVNISENMETIGLTSVRFLKRRITEEGFKDFEVQYMAFITACNSCHRQVEKGFVLITKPATPPFDNQDFSQSGFLGMPVDSLPENKIQE